MRRSDVIHTLDYLVLFDLFDFNELNSLSLVDLEFMLISCCNAIFKILGYRDVINEEEICEFLSNYYNDDSRINISQMLKYILLMNSKVVLQKQSNR